MTLPTVAVGDAIKAALANQVNANINSSPSAVIFTSNGSWAVPEGVHKFRVLVIPGGAGGDTHTTGGSGEESYTIPGADGKPGIAVVGYYSGVAIGTTFAVVVGAGGAAESAGSQSSFGGTLIAPGATAPASAAYSAGTFPGGFPTLYMTPTFRPSPGSPYGAGGAGSVGAGAGAGSNGAVIIEW